MFADACAVADDSIMLTNIRSTEAQVAFLCLLLFLPLLFGSHKR